MNGIQIKQVVPAVLLADVLVTAFEGGIGYWSCLCKHIEPDEAEGVDLADLKDDSEYPPYGYYPLTATGFLLLCDAEDDGISVDGWPEQYWVLDRDAITRGASVMSLEYPLAWERILREEFDADDADIFVQLSVFGEVVYG